MSVLSSGTRPLPLVSKLPQVGATIFSTMSARCAQVGGINLSQGFPDFGADPDLLDRAAWHLQQGHNQYAPSTGLPALRQQVAAFVQRDHGLDVNPDTEVTIYSGASEALYVAIQALTQPGDEVIVLEPCYDLYVPAIQAADAVPVPLPLVQPGYSLPLDAIAAALGPRTRAILINSPHNPSGQVISADEMQALQSLLAPTGVFVISDEVYRDIVFGTEQHQSICLYPELWQRSVVIGSFGKMLHVTGWKTGFSLAPAYITSELRKLHQYITFSTATPLQHALADYLAANPDAGAAARSLYLQKRDFFSNSMAASRFTPLPCQGTYFRCYGYEQISNLPELDFCLWLLDTHGVAAIPLSPFYMTGAEHKTVRFCFAKKEETLAAATDRLCQI